MLFSFYRLRKDVLDGRFSLFRCREDHASQKPCSGGGLGFMHDPFKMFFDGVFAQMDAVCDFFIGKTEHEINDDHLLPFGEVIPLPHIGVWAPELLLMELFHDDEESAVLCERFIGNTEPAKEEPLVVGKIEPFHLDGLAILGVAALYQSTAEFVNKGMNLIGHESGTALSSR